MEKLVRWLQWGLVWLEWKCREAKAWKANKFVILDVGLGKGGYLVLDG